MIKLANGAKVLAAYVTMIDAEPARATGVVLAEHLDREFATWLVWEGDSVRCIFESETGHYFPFLRDRGAARQEAEIDFGKRLAMILSANAYEGLRQSCGGV